jgi:uncharacterized SAM-binding protein YcdF (DUF218 family)
VTDRPVGDVAALATAPAPERAPRAQRLYLRLTLIITTLLAAWVLGLAWFVATMPIAIADPDTKTDAIVVLTGGTQRLASGLDLLAAGKAKKLFVSGVHQGVAIADLLRVSRHGAELASRIVLGHEANSTLGNALETAAWMRHEGYESLRLVTADYHMRRSLLDFELVMPDIRIIANPVFPELTQHTNWWESPGTAMLLIGEYNKYLGALIRTTFALPASESELPDTPDAT